MARPSRSRFFIALLLIIGISGGAIVAQPFTAQIQLALQTLGLWPYGVYANGEIPVWDTATNRFLPGSGGGGLQTDVNIAEVGGVAIGTAVPVTDGAGALNVIVDSGTLTTLTTLTSITDNVNVIGTLAADGAASGTNRVGTLPAIAETGALPTLADTRNASLYVDTNGKQYTRVLDPCSAVAKSYYVVNTTSAATFEIANAVASEFWYICSVNVVVGAAQGLLIASDDTDGCGSITAGLNGGTTAATGFQFAANGGEAAIGGNAAVMKSATANHYLCLLTSTTAQTSGTIAYVSAP
jgi:hypothetical protein